MCAVSKLIESCLSQKITPEELIHTKKWLAVATLRKKRLIDTIPFCFRRSRLVVSAHHIHHSSSREIGWLVRFFVWGFMRCWLCNLGKVRSFLEDSNPMCSREHCYPVKCIVITKNFSCVLYNVVSPTENFLFLVCHNHDLSRPCYFVTTITCCYLLSP